MSGRHCGQFAIALHLEIFALNKIIFCQVYYYQWILSCVSAGVWPTDAHERSCLPLVLGGVRCGLRAARPGNHTPAPLNNTNISTLTRAGKQPNTIALSGIKVSFLISTRLASPQLKRPEGKTEIFAAY